MVKMTLNDLEQNLTEEELQELEAAEKKEPVFDEDSPAMTHEQLMQFKRVKPHTTEVACFQGFSP